MHFSYYFIIVSSCSHHNLLKGIFRTNLFFSIKCRVNLNWMISTRPKSNTLASRIFVVGIVIISSALPKIIALHSHNLKRDRRKDVPLFSTKNFSNLTTHLFYGTSFTCIKTTKPRIKPSKQLSLSKIHSSLNCW